MNEGRILKKKKKKAVSFKTGYHHPGCPDGKQSSRNIP